MRNNFKDLGDRVPCAKNIYLAFRRVAKSFDSKKMCNFLTMQIFHEQRMFLSMGAEYTIAVELWPPARYDTCSANLQGHLNPTRQASLNYIRLVDPYLTLN